MRSLLVWFVAALAACAGASPAQAAWHVAKSRHFIIYADERPDKLHAFATRLEKFDQAARTVLNWQDPPVGDGNRLAIYVLPTADEVRKLAGEKSGFLEGFYAGRATGPLVYVAKPALRPSENDPGAESIIYHEYAHHLMMQFFDQPYPEWYVEGFAEFMSTPIFAKDGSVGLGAPPNHRAWGLFQGGGLPLETLLSGAFQASALSKEQRESFYGRGWLLVHHLFLEPKRDGQLNRYILAIAGGTPPLEAARAAFGDLKQLDQDLTAYLHRRKLTHIKIAPGAFRPVPVELQPLTPGAAQAVLLRAKLKYDLPAAEREALSAQLRQVQQRFPGDELVEATLAEVELDAGRPQAASAAADRAIKANPRNTEALVAKGRAAADLAEATADDKAAKELFEQARQMFIAANRIDPEDPEPLYEFYRAFLREGVRPTANAIAALHAASERAPQDIGLRMNSAVVYLIEGKAAEARRPLVPVAYHPHAEKLGQVARQALARIAAGDVKGALEAARTGR